MLDFIIVGVDTGGTFTDLIYYRQGKWEVCKVLSTPDDPSRAVLRGLERIFPEARVSVVHGSTVATNALLERKGVKTAIITNTGFQDLIEIGRQSRTELYNLAYRKPAPVVPRNLRFGVSGRLDASGREVEALDTGDLEEIKTSIRSENVESVAVCLLFSYLDSAHENTIRQKLRDLDLPLSLSHEILGEFREFERLSTTVVNAYVAPRMSGYLQKIQDYLDSSPLRIMQSNGGSISAEEAMREPVRTILSGPAGGVVGAAEVGRAAGFSRLITLDMGGTSTDVSLIDGELPLSTESCLAGYPLKVPMLDIHTVGAGGGSVAHLDAGGSLRVGPESAGADPGPICYGRGDLVTVTDAHLYLGRLLTQRFLGGDMALDTDRVGYYMENMAREAGLTSVQLAEGILSVADTNMERAIRVISVERGFDPREFILVSFGGAGGLHCAQLASMLSIPRVLVPTNPGVLSALGMVRADVIKDYSRTVMLGQEEASLEHLDSMFRILEGRAREEMQQEGFSGGKVSLKRSLDMRYQGQSFELGISWETGDIWEGFQELHSQKYGYRHQGRGMEVVNLRLRATGIPEKPELGQAEESGPQVPDKARLGEQEVVFGQKFHAADLLDRAELLPGNEFLGPAIVSEYTSTIVVPPFARGRVDGFGNIIIEFES